MFSSYQRVTDLYHVQKIIPQRSWGGHFHTFTFSFLVPPDLDSAAVFVCWNAGKVSYTATDRLIVVSMLNSPWMCQGRRWPLMKSWRHQQCSQSDHPSPALTHASGLFRHWGHQSTVWEQVTNMHKQLINFHAMLCCKNYNNWETEAFRDQKVSNST